MRTRLSHTMGWRCLAVMALLLSLGQAAMVGAEESSGELNVPPDGFTALFNGKDFAGWRVHPKVKEIWSIEDGVLKSHGLLEEWGADLVTKKEYQDYVLVVDFRMPALSDSGIHFRNLAPAMLGTMGDAEQFNIRSKGGMGQLESLHFVPDDMKLTEEQRPQIKYIDPEIGVWHTIKLTVVGKNVTAELDGEVILDHFEYPEGMLKAGPNPIRFQKHRFTEGAKPGERNPCPIEFRNIFIKEIKVSDSAQPRGLNVPPEGFTALFNGVDLTGWNTRPEVSENWFVEDGLLKSTTLVEHYRASLLTKNRYRDFILMLEFRMPTISDSGICFRRLIPEIPGFGTKEQFNLRSRGGMGHLESYYFLPKETAKKVGLKEEEKPHVRHIDPEVGVWHKVKLTMKGRTFSAEYDGEVLHDNFQFHDWMMNMEPAPIMLQKHMVVRGDNLGDENPCPIEYRNVFIKELGPDDTVSAPSPSRGEGWGEGHANSPQVESRNAELLTRIDAGELPEGYVPAKHQEYVDRRWPKLSPEQVARALQLWKVKQAIDPDMPNQGFSFVKIMEFVAEHENPQNTNEREETTTEVPIRPPAPPKTVTRPTSSSSSTNRPNVVVLLADDLGWGDIGCYGGPVKTPILDSLATRGVRFTDFHAGAAICSPSRATLLTGRQHLRTGIYGVLQDPLHNSHLLQREVTIAEVLQQAGYSTAHFGKWHIGMTSGKRKKPSPTEHGFGYWFGLSNGAHPSHKDPVNFLRNGEPVGPLNGYSCQLLVDDAIRWLDGKDKPDRPFFLNVWFNEPHHPLAAPDEIVSQYGDLEDEAAIYSATIDNTDRAIGRLVAKLEDMGQLDNTLIVYSSDNGSYRADRNGGLHGSKGSNFEGGLRSPGIFFWPRGIRGGRIENTPSGSVDLLPTICGLVGIQKPPSVHLDGADLSPLLTEQGQFQRAQPLFWLAPTSGHLATLRDGHYTLMGYRGYDLPEDHATQDKLQQQMARLAGIDEDAENLRSRIANTTFTSPEFRRLRGEYVKLTTFQESWIPIIKSGGFTNFALYDLEADPKQTKDISREQAEVTSRLKKQLLTLYKSVMADAPDWSTQQRSSPD